VRGGGGAAPPKLWSVLLYLQQHPTSINTLVMDGFDTTSMLILGAGLRARAGAGPPLWGPAPAALLAPAAAQGSGPSEPERVEPAAAGVVGRPRKPGLRLKGLEWSGATPRLPSSPVR